MIARKQYGPEGYHVICLDPSQKAPKTEASAADGVKGLLVQLPSALLELIEIVYIEAFEGVVGACVYNNLYRTLGIYV